MGRIFTGSGSGSPAQALPGGYPLQPQGSFTVSDQAEALAVIPQSTRTTWRRRFGAARPGRGRIFREKGRFFGPFLAALQGVG